MILRALTISCLVIVSTTASSEAHWATDLQTCKVFIDNQLTELPLAAPCTPAITVNRDLQIRNIGDRKIAIILGAPASKKIASQWNMKESDQCSTESVAIALSDLNKPTAVSKPARNSFLCPTIHIDQVFFMSYKW